MRGFKDHSLHMLMLDEGWQLKLKPGINYDHRVIVAISNDLRFRGMEIKEEGEKIQISKETISKLTWKQWFCAGCQMPTSDCT